MKRQTLAGVLVMTSLLIALPAARASGENDATLFRLFLKDGGKAKSVEVTTGIADDTNVEIKSGVKVGDAFFSPDGHGRPGIGG